MSGTGIRIVELPDLGAVTDASSVVAEKAGSGRLSAPALRSYCMVGTLADAPVNGIAYGRFNATWQPVLSAAGGTVAALNVSGSSSIGGTLTTGGNGYFNAIGISPVGSYEWSFSVDGSGNHVESHRAGWAEIWFQSTGDRVWTSPVLGNAMMLEGAGRLRVKDGTDGGIAAYQGTSYLTLNGGTVFSAGTGGMSSIILNGGGRATWDFEFYANGALMWGFHGDGRAFKTGGGTWTDFSDARIKRDVTDYTTGLAEILQLRPVSYRYIPEVHRPDRLQYGLIAQEVETVMPEMVTQEQATVGGVTLDDFRVLDTQALVFALVRAVQELAGKVEALEAAAA